jgi:hypothetical protein
MVLRLPETRDFYKSAEKSNPVVEYYKTKSQNEKFFKQKSEDRLDLTKFMGTTNHLTASKNSVGVANFKQYLLEKDRRTTSDWLLPESEKKTLTTSNHSKSKAKFLEMK